jgi:hypothetical protein
MYVLWNKEKSKGTVQPLFYSSDRDNGGLWIILEFAKVYTEEEVLKIIETIPFEGQFIKLPATLTMK